MRVGIGGGRPWSLILGVLLVPFGLDVRLPGLTDNEEMARVRGQPLIRPARPSSSISRTWINAAG